MRIWGNKVREVKFEPFHPERTSQIGIDLIKRWEGFSPTIYMCQAGIPTIGYGTALFTEEEYKVFKDKSITKEEAENLLRKEVLHIEKKIKTCVKVPLSQGQFDALVSFCYNLGTNAFKNSTLCKVINRYEYDQADFQFARWVYAGGRKLRGLQRRRQAEIKLWKSNY